MLIKADARRIPLRDKSVHCVVTSPPYWGGLRDYKIRPSVWGGDPACKHKWSHEIVRALRGTVGDYSTLEGRKLAPGRVRFARQGAFCRRCKAWLGALGAEPTPEMYVQHLVEVFREIRRVLRDDGSVWLNIGDCFISSWSCARRSRIGNPAAESENRMNRISGHLKEKDLAGIPFRVVFALQTDGWWWRQKITWCKVAPTPESVKDRPSSATEEIFLLTKRQDYFYDHVAVREPHKQSSLARALRQRHCGKYEDSLHFEHGNLKRGRGYGPDGDPDTVCHPAGRNMLNYWVLGPAPFPEAHFATFPPEIPKRAILAGTSQKGCCPRCGSQWERIVVDDSESRVSSSSSLYPEGSTARRLALLRQTARKNGREYQYKIHADRWRPGCQCRQTQTMPSVVLDPFVGSGTTARAAEELGRRWIGIDLGYHDISKRRVAGATPALSLV